MLIEIYRSFQNLNTLHLNDTNAYLSFTITHITHITLFGVCKKDLRDCDKSLHYLKVTDLC